MTLEDYLNMPIEELDKLTHQQKIDFCKPFWNVTRPTEEMLSQAKEKSKPTKQSIKEIQASNLQKALALFEQLKNKNK